MTPRPPSTLHQVVAMNVAMHRRETRGWSQDDLASECRQCGLDWSQDRIAQFEAGRGKLSVETLLLLAAALRVNVADLLRATGRVELGNLVLPGDDLVELLGPDPHAVVAGRVQIPAHLVGETEETLAFIGVKPTRDKVRRAVDASRGHAERRLAKEWYPTLDPDEAALWVGAYCIGLWGRGLTEERDERAGDGANAMKRSWASRALVAELRTYASEQGLGPKEAAE